MKIILVTGSGGLIGSESVHFFCNLGFTVIGIDNNMRQVFFGEDGSTDCNQKRLLESYGDRYIHHNVDIRDKNGIKKIF
jgi:CDP-paratose 2-epimerase